MKKVLIFGTFDGVHGGHRSLFAQAHEHGDYLMAVIARDCTVEGIKGRAALHSETQRHAGVLAEDLVDHAVLGYTTGDKHAIITDLAPDVIVLGYDQQHFTEELEAFVLEQSKPIVIIRAQAHEPHIFKSSLINNHKHKSVWKEK